MKILICGNSLHSSTGYGTQIKGIVKAMQGLGHDAALLCTYGVQGGVLTIEGVPHYPTYRDNWGQDTVGMTVKHFGADCVLTLHDAWVLSDGFQQKAGVPWVCVSPIDSEPAAPRTVAVMKQARYPVTYSKFGQAELEKAGVKSDYIPHAIDTDVFCPGDKAAARAALSLPQDRFIVGFVGANKGYPNRKAIPEQFAAFAEFRKTHPDAILLLHTQKQPVGHWADGIYLDPLLIDLGIASAVFTTNEYLSAMGLFEPKDVANVYRAADVMLHASYAEGFGLCALEAQACGTPVITTNFSSMPELTFNGICTEPLQRIWSLLNCWQVVPDVKAVATALATVAGMKSWYPEGNAKLDSTVAAIRAAYSWPVVTETYWKPFLERVECEIKDIAAMTATGD